MDDATVVEGNQWRWAELGVGIATLGVGAVLVAAIPDLHHAVWLAIHGDFDGLRVHIRGLGIGGLLLLAGLILVHAVLFYPAEIATATAGFVYGFPGGLVVAVACWLASALLAFFLGRTVGRPLLYTVFGRTRFGRLERMLERGGVPFLLTARLVPIVPFSLVCYVAGAVRIPVWRFAWTTVIGFLPMTAAVAYLGSQARSLSLSDPFVWLVAVVLVGLLVATRFMHPGQPGSGRSGDA